MQRYKSAFTRVSLPFPPSPGKDIYIYAYMHIYIYMYMHNRNNFSKTLLCQMIFGKRFFLIMHPFYLGQCNILSPTFFNFIVDFCQI